MAISDFYKVEDGKVTRLRKACPKCGPGYFMAQHKGRTACGNCGYTEFESRSPPAPKPESKPAVPEPAQEPTPEPAAEADAAPPAAEEPASEPAEEATA